MLQKRIVDDLDLKILREYLRDARQSYRQIARNIKSSPATVKERTMRMEQECVIKGYTAIVDHERLGYDITVVTEITVSKGKLVEMESEISKLSQCCAVYDVTGSTDAVVIAKFKSRRELSDFTKSILRLPFVERTNSHIVLTTVKEDFRNPAF